MFACCRPKVVKDQFEEIVGPDAGVDRSDSNDDAFGSLMSTYRPSMSDESMNQPQHHESQQRSQQQLHQQQSAKSFAQQRSFAGLVKEQQEFLSPPSIRVVAQPEDNLNSNNDDSSDELQTPVPSHSFFNNDDMNNELTPITPPMTVAAPSTPNPPKSTRVVVPPLKTTKPPPTNSPPSVREAQEKLLQSARAKASPRPKAAAKKGWQPQNYSADVSGLRTKNRDKMIDLVDEGFKKELLKAVNFVREISDKDARDVPDVPNREKAALLYMFLKSVDYEIEGKQNVVSTVLAHITGNAEGEKALATTKVKAAAKKLQFMAKAYYKPALEQLQNPNPKQTIAQVVDDMHTTANVLFGEKPPTMKERTNPFMSDILSKWKWSKCKEWQSSNPSEYKKDLERLIDAFEVCRKSGSSYIQVVNDIEKKIS